MLCEGYSYRFVGKKARYTRCNQIRVSQDWFQRTTCKFVGGAGEFLRQITVKENDLVVTLEGHRDMSYTLKEALFAEWLIIDILT